MLLKDLISKNKILFDLLKNVPEKILNHNVNGISGNSKNVKNDYVFVAIKGIQFKNFIQLLFKFQNNT